MIIFLLLILVVGLRTDDKVDALVALLSLSKIRRGPDRSKGPQKRGTPLRSSGKDHQIIPHRLRLGEPKLQQQQKSLDSADEDVANHLDSRILIRKTQNIHCRGSCNVLNVDDHHLGLNQHFESFPP